jgi:cell division septum initiation protein DivIVA
MWKRDRELQGPAPPPDGPEPLGPEFEHRMESILGDVRQEADRILDDARRRAENATSDLDEALTSRRRRLLELYESLIARTEVVLARLDEVEFGRDNLGRMLRAVSQAADELTQEVAGAREHAGGEDLSEDRQQAIRMAAAGATRGEVEAQLHALSGQSGDPAGLLDEVFGPETEADARVPWAYDPRPE